MSQTALQPSPNTSLTVKTRSVRLQRCHTAPICLHSSALDAATGVRAPAPAPTRKSPQQLNSVHPHHMACAGGSKSAGPWGWLQRKFTTRSSSLSNGAAASTTPPPPTHLIVMVNGLFGSATNWDVMCEQLRQHLPPDTLLHASKVNARFATYGGIDACGSRLADEVRGVVAAAGPSLTRISIIAHSMGGLMARYAIGCLYNPATAKLCGLTPCHLITMATPHCGCDADGVAQVPFIGWTGDIPLLGQQLYRFLSSISGSTASLIFQRTGQQFFMMDGGSASAGGGGGGSSSDSARTVDAAAAAAATDGLSSSSTSHLPLLLQLTQDCPDRGLYFYSALAAFKTRTCYANMDGDHLVGFANSSLRSLQQLPPPPPTASSAKGVVLEDSLSAAFWPHHWSHLQQQQQWVQGGEVVGRGAGGGQSSTNDAGGNAAGGGEGGGGGVAATTTTAAAAAEGTGVSSQAAAVVVREVLSQPYTASRDWTHARRQRQQRQQQQQLASSKTSSNNNGSSNGNGTDGSSWHELLNGRGPAAAAAVDDAITPRQQQQQRYFRAADMAAVELEAGGAMMASTAAAAAAAAMHYSPMQQALGGGGGQQRQLSTTSTAAAAAGSTDEEVLDLQYSSPVQEQEQQPAVSSLDGVPPAQAQQQRQQQQRVARTATATAAAAAQDAAAVASAEADLTSGLSGQAGRPMVPVAASPAAAASDVAADAAAMATAVGGAGGGAADGSTGGSRAAVVSHMLRRLQELPWRRIDVSFQGAKFGFAHNNIQVTRRWWNFEGVAVPAHLAQQLQLIDALVLMGLEKPGQTQQRQS